MATHFSANQYENAFAAKRLQNWETPASFKERPSRLEGFTQPIANNRGHLLPGVRHSQKSPWGDFVGTWDHGAKSKNEKPLKPQGCLSKLSYDHGAPEVLAVHSPTPCTPGKDNTEKPPSPVPEPVDEKNIGISKHINAVKEKERKESEKQETSVTFPNPEPEKF